MLIYNIGSRVDCIKSANTAISNYATAARIKKHALTRALSLNKQLIGDRELRESVLRAATHAGRCT